jgi:pimeloyl-ACP methyl ester carboxylesterase
LRTGNFGPAQIAVFEMTQKRRNSLAPIKSIAHLHPSRNQRAKCILMILFCLAFAGFVAAQPPPPHPELRKPVAERLAAIPNLDARLATLEKALDSASDQTSLSATTARYTLEILKDAIADPKAYEARSLQFSTFPPVPKAPSKELSDYIATLDPLDIDLDAELARSEMLAVAVQNGRDPMAGVTGDVHLAYRSSLDGMLLPYRIYVPKGYTPTLNYPLIVFLHGAMSDENTFMAPEVLQPAAERYGYLVVAINGRGPISFYSKESGAQQDMLDVMVLMQKYYKVDSNRVFLTGHSMGGMGTWKLGLEFREKFAALAPQAGTGLMPDLDAKLTTGRKIPILITVGGKDSNVLPGPAIEVYRKLKEAGYPTKIVVYPEDDHNTVFHSSVPEVFGWFDKFGKSLPAGAANCPR